MKRMLALCVLTMIFVSCNKAETDLYVSPMFIDPTLGPDEAIVKIAVLPFLSALHHGDDPDGYAPMTLNKFFVPLLDERSDYIFVSPNTVTYAIDREGWMKEYEDFKEKYPTSSAPDMAFLGPLAEILRVDAFMIPVVDLWQKDEVDFQENATPATYVGATLTIIDAKNDPGALLFRSISEEYIEGARTETGDRSIVSTAGKVRSDAAARNFRAPPFEEVAIKVVEVLVESLPVR